jgi:hypothetical protein
MASASAASIRRPRLIASDLSAIPTSRNRSTDCRSSRSGTSDARLDVAFALIDEAPELDLNLMAAWLALDQPSDIGLGIVAGGRGISHTAATRSCGTVTTYQGAANSTR